MRNTKSTAAGDANQWAKVAALHRELGMEVNDPGFTVAEYAARFGCAYKTASTRLTALSRQGRLREGWRYVKSTAGRHKARVYVLLPTA